MDTLYLHVFFDGKSHDIAVETLDVDLNASDREVIEAVERAMNLNLEELYDYVLDRVDMSIYPKATYG